MSRKYTSFIICQPKSSSEKLITFALTSRGVRVLVYMQNYLIHMSKLE